MLISMFLVTELQRVLPNNKVEYRGQVLFVDNVLIPLHNWNGDEIETFHSLSQYRRDILLEEIKGFIAPLVLVSKPTPAPIISEKKVEVKEEVVAKVVEPTIVEKVIEKPVKKTSESKKKVEVIVEAPVTPKEE